MDDPQLMARQLYERMTIDELHELVQLARKARDEKLEDPDGGKAICQQKRWQVVIDPGTISPSTSRLDSPGWSSSTWRGR